MLELNVKVININLPIHHEILNKYKPLYEYSWFVQRMKEYLRAGTKPHIKQQKGTANGAEEKDRSDNSVTKTDCRADL